MNQYAFSALIAFALMGMGLLAGILGTMNYIENTHSKTGKVMCCTCWCVFFWNFGYAWMSLSYDSDFAYYPRALALLAVVAYMAFVIKYVATVTNYPEKKINTFILVIALASIISWFHIISKNAVDFVMTPWGYWYVSKMSWARILQFLCILITLIQYYRILAYGRKYSTSKRENFVLMHFGWFGPIFFLGCMLDTFVPTFFHTAAIPGSSIAAFFSSMLLYSTSRTNKTFGLSVTNISEYVFKDVSIPVIITDKMKRITMFNSAAIKYLKCREVDLNNNRVEYFFVEEEDDLYRVAGNKEVCKLDRTDVCDRFGEVMYYIYFVQDVTKERKNLKMLSESREMAEKANQAKSDFLANMSHEIRTPLNVVLGIDEMILRHSEDEVIIDYAENIKQAGNLLLSLINDILDFSKIESGKMEINIVEFETEAMLKDIYLILAQKAESKNLKLTFDIDPKLPSKLMGDDVRIRQILINILNNSIKYTQEGSISLTIGLESVDNEKAKLHFSIKDTGIGIKEEELSHLFEAFQRADVIKNRNIEGTGLGLSITSRLLNLMKSDLCVKSEYGKGSEFYFDLFLSIADKTALGELKLDENGTKRRRVKKEYDFVAPMASVLVVDDNRVNLKVAGGLLSRSLVKVSTALSGHESIELVKNNKYDIIFMDHMMPGMDGIETVSKIRALDENMSKDAVIIALTANAISGAKEMFLANGFDDFLAKPIKVDDLEEKLKYYLPEDKVEIISK